MREVKIVLSKELSRIFHDKKMIFSLFVLPILLVVGMFALMSFLSSMETSEIESHVASVYIADCPDSFKQFVNHSQTGAQIQYVDKDRIETVKADIKEGKADLLLTFETDFDDKMDAQKLSDIGVYYNPSEDNSSAAYDYWMLGLEAYRQLLQENRFGSIDSIKMFTVNETGSPEDFELYDNAKAAGKILGTMLPYFITLLLFAGAMSLGVDTIAGEKERGTMASLLVTPVKRTKIVLGKLISLMVISVMSALVYVIALAVAMPMLGQGSEQVTEMLGDLASIFSPVQLLELLVIMIGIVFLYVATIGLVSVYAKDTKEASTYVMPAYIIVIGVGMVTMFGSASTGLVEYAIPFYNCSITLKAILMGELSTAQFAISAVSTFVAAGLITVFIGKLFNSERIMFNS